MIYSCIGTTRGNEPIALGSGGRRGIVPDNIGQEGNGDEHQGCVGDRQSEQKGKQVDSSVGRYLQGGNHEEHPPEKNDGDDWGGASSRVLGNEQRAKGYMGKTQAGLRCYRIWPIRPTPGK